MQYVIFKIAQDEFGVPVEQVREVVSTPGINPLPQAPAFIEGICRLRNHSIAVINMRTRFNLPQKADTGNSNILVVRLNGMVVGLEVDRVVDIIDVSEKQIDNASTIVGSFLDGKTVTGVAHVDKRDIVILDLTRVLDVNELNNLNGFKTKNQKTKD